MPRAYRAITFSSKPSRRRWCFLTSFGSKVALPIARNANPDGTRLGLHDLLAVTVAGVGCSSASLLLVAKVLGDLGLEKPLHHRTFELGEHTVGPEQVLLRTGSGDERIDEFLLGNQPIPIGRLSLLLFFICFHERLPFKSPTSSTYTSFLTRPEGAGDFDCRAGFAALRESDGEDARLVRDGLPSSPFGSIQRGASRALSSLLPKLSISDANPGHPLNQRQRELIGDELVMRQRLRRFRERHASNTRRRRDGAPTY